VTLSESEAEDEGEGKGDEEEESGPPKHIRYSSKSKPGAASTSKANAKATTIPTRKKPLCVYSENDEDESGNSDSKAEQNEDDEADEADENFLSPHLAFSKAAAKSSATKKAGATQVTSNLSRNRKPSIHPPNLSRNTPNPLPQNPNQVPRWTHHHHHPPRKARR
jgi:hypothetical protein